MKNKHKFPGTESGQALILITFAIIGLIGLTGLAVDGSLAYSDRRNAQNAADSAAMAAALAHVRNGDIQTTALGITSSNGYEDVTVTSVPSPSGCPAGSTNNKDITVQIVSKIDTTFATVVGIRQMTNRVTATSRACGTYIAPLFGGDAIVALNPSMSDCGIDTGNSNSKTWNVTGGGIFSNGCATHPNGTLNIPNDKCLTSVGNATVTGGGSHACIQKNQSAKKYKYPEDIAAIMPPNPCTGAVTNGRYAGGGKIPTNGQTTFENDIFCISDFSTLDAHVVLTNSTLYVTDKNFDVKFNGGGAKGFSGTATTTSGSPYKGYYMVITMTDTKAGADNCNQNIEYRGNGDSELVGTILAPSACFDSRGNAQNDSTRSQFIFYNVSSNGTADIRIQYNAADNHQEPVDPTLQMLK